MRVTYYDHIARCYKLKDDVSVNIIQRMGKIEDAIEAYKAIEGLPFSENTPDWTADRIKSIINAFESA